MVDVTSRKNFFSGPLSQPRITGVNEATRVLDLAAQAIMRLDQALNEGFQAAGLTPAQGRALRAIAAEPGLTVGRLTARLGISKQSLAPVLKSLTSEGFVSAGETDTDRRRRLLHLTDRGEAAWMKAAEGARNLLVAASAASGPAAARGFETVLHRLARLADGPTTDAQP